MRVEVVSKCVVSSIVPYSPVFTLLHLHVSDLKVVGSYSCLHMYSNGSHSQLREEEGGPIDCERRPHTHTHTPYACSDRGGQNSMPDPLEAELQMVMSHHVGAGNLWVHNALKY